MGKDLVNFYESFLMHFLTQAAMQSQRTEGRTEVRQIASTDGLEEPTTKAVDRIFRAIRKLHDKGLMPVDFFEFVIDPESFSATVENIFHLR